MAFLSLQNIIKKFGSSLALNDVSFEVEKGEFVCLLGPSGCGKTTLLRIIAGLEQQSSGTIIQDGVDVSNLPVKKRDFGIVFQSYALFPNQTVAQNIAFGLKSQKYPKQEIAARVESLVSTMGLEEHINKYPDQLSGGQQQRVALARALALNPGLLLLDEPLSALDAKVRQRLRAEIKRVQKDLGITTIMVTHDQEEALSMADKIVVMNQGQIEQIGSPAEIYDQPSSRFVGEFVGAMNFLPAAKQTSGILTNEKLGISYRVEAGAPHSDNQAMCLAVRPEHILVGANALKEQADQDVVLSAKIAEVEFFGRFSRLSLTIEEDNLVLHADIPLSEFDHGAVKVGETIELCIPEASVQVFQTEAHESASKANQERVN